MRYSKIKIKEEVFNSLIKVGLTPTDVTDESYSYNYRNSQFRFYIKEIPNWIFGLWTFSDKGYIDADFKGYKVYFFGEKVDWIDKFKPTATNISSKIIVPRCSSECNFNPYYEPDWVVWNVRDQLLRLKNSRLVAEYEYCKSDTSYLKWLLSEFWFYKIENPISKWYDNHALGLVFRVVSLWFKLKYHKYIKVRPLKDFTKENFFPKWEVGVEYKDSVDSDTIYDIWNELEESKLVKWINKQNARFDQYEDSTAKRGFYYDE